MDFSLNETQLSGMGEALIQGGSGLLHIAIQLLPYAIVFTIILLIFGLIKNWSKLKWNKSLGDTRQAPGVFHDDEEEDVDPYSLVDALNYYQDDEFDGVNRKGNHYYTPGKYFVGKKGDIGHSYWSEGKKYTEFADPWATYIDDLSDKEYHYRKRHGLLRKGIDY